METGELGALVTQFGMAGLIAWMWLTERRSSAERERQLTEMHERIRSERTETHVLMSALSENTRAMSALEAGQRGLVSLLTRVLDPRRAGEDG